MSDNASKTTDAYTGASGLLDEMMVDEGLEALPNVDLSDETKLGTNTWANIKHAALAYDFDK